MSLLIDSTTLGQNAGADQLTPFFIPVPVLVPVPVPVPAPALMLVLGVPVLALILVLVLVLVPTETIEGTEGIEGMEDTVAVPVLRWKRWLLRSKRSVLDRSNKFWSELLLLLPVLPVLLPLLSANPSGALWRRPYSPAPAHVAHESSTSSRAMGRIWAILDILAESRFQAVQRCC
jgi:hypothetical protein